MSLDTHNLHETSRTLPDVDTYKEVAVSHPPRPTIEHSLNNESTLQVSDRDCTLEFSDRDCNLELHQYADDKPTDRHAHAGTGVGDQGNGNERQPAADGKQDPELESVTGTVKRHKYHRREWIILSSALGAVVLLVVIIVPSVIFGTRQSRPQYKPPPNPYTS